MNRLAAIASALSATALAAVGVAWYTSRPDTAEADESGTIVPIIAPEITMQLAEHILSCMEHLPQDDVTVVLHTYGGEVTACVMIADALRKFHRSTAVVPYMAFSGGTVIALNATHLALGKNAALSAVDPVIYGMRGRHIPAVVDQADNPLHPLAAEYGTAVSDYLQQTLRARLGPDGGASMKRAMDTFLGLHRPHSWPIHASQLGELGLPVMLAGPEWSRFVDEYRKTCYLRALSAPGLESRADILKAIRDAVRDGRGR